MNWPSVDKLMGYNNCYNMGGNNFDMDDIYKIGYYWERNDNDLLKLLAFLS